MAEKLIRKEIKHDKFVEDVNIAYGYLQKNRPVLFLAIAGVAALIAATWGVFAYREAQERKAQARLGEAITILGAPVSETPQGAGPVYRTEEEKTTKAQPILEEVAKEYGGTDAADIAELFLARLAATRGDLETARPKLERFVREHGDHVLAGGAQLSLYEMDLASGRARDLITELERKLNDKSKILPNDALLALLARAYQAADDRVKAREAYQRLVNEYPDSPYAIDAQRELQPV
ncbi:MAG TPA: tetratricopeptide repeat protein [Thermoanaerobaculia bacterium]|nr:tetratricopeptide repeat protein [Thermoanaerobaculia bacterium]